MSTLTSFIRRIVWSKQVFEFWQKLGVNVTKKHFSCPIPDLKELAERQNIWTKETSVGFDINLEKQLYFLEEVFEKYKNELNFKLNRTAVAHEYYLNNAGFGLEDAGVLHCMVRHFKPKNIIEVGSGNSTLVSARAVTMNEKEGHPCRITAIEPYAREYLKKGFPGLDGLIIRKAEQMEPDFFEQLTGNDILFIDTSHVMRVGNDVNFLYLEVLPRLNKGVIVHQHDIFIPYDYPQKWVIDQMCSWTEQYILQAFLCLNESYEVLFGNNCMMTKYPEKMSMFFSRPKCYRAHVPSSFWTRKN